MVQGFVCAGGVYAIRADAQFANRSAGTAAGVLDTRSRGKVRTHGWMQSMCGKRRLTYSRVQNQAGRMFDGGRTSTCESGCMPCTPSRPHMNPRFLRPCTFVGQPVPDIDMRSVFVSSSSNTFIPNKWTVPMSSGTRFLYRIHLPFDLFKLRIHVQDLPAVGDPPQWTSSPTALPPLS